MSFHDNHRHQLQKGQRRVRLQGLPYLSEAGSPPRASIPDNGTVKLVDANAATRSSSESHDKSSESHRQSGADITISSLPMDDSRASDFGLMKIDAKGIVISFGEKPKGKDLKAMAVDTTVLGLSKEEAEKKPYIASMGVYVFKKEILLNLLSRRLKGLTRNSRTKVKRVLAYEKEFFRLYIQDDTGTWINWNFICL